MVVEIVVAVVVDLAVVVTVVVLAFSEDRSVFQCSCSLVAVTWLFVHWPKLADARGAECLALARGRFFDDMFQEHETLRFIPGRETDDAEPNVEDEGLEDTIKRKFKKFVEEFTYKSKESGKTNQDTKKYMDQLERNFRTGVQKLEVATWRGTSTMLSVHHAAMQSAEMGRHFRACAWAKAGEDRARAAEWAARRRRKVHGKVEDVRHQTECTELVLTEPMCPLCGAALSDCDCVQRSMTGPTPEKDRSSQEASVSKQASLQAAGRRASLARRMSVQVGRRQSADMDGLGVGRQTSDRRKSNDKQKKPPTLTRLQRLIQAKRMEFEALPEGKKERFRSAYDHALAESWLSVGQEGLGGPQLRQALADLGLAGRQNHEKEAVHEVVRECIAAGLVDFLEFVFQVVPKVEQKLVEAKSPKLLGLFNQLDVAMAGSLSCSDCIEALRRHADSFITVLDGDIMEQFWPVFVKELAQQHKVSKHSDETIDFANFQRLASEAWSDSEDRKISL
eukprot:s125_g43.t1